MLGTAGLAAVGSVLGFRQQPHELPPGASRVAPPRPGGFAHDAHASHENMMAVGEFAPGSFDPAAFLTHFDMGTVSQLPSVSVRGENLGNSLHREATSRIKDFAPNAGRNVALVYRVFF
jgi:hypothetical protein